MSIISSIYLQKRVIRTERLDIYQDVVEQLVVQLEEEKSITRLRIEDPKGLRKLDFLKILAFDRFFVDQVSNDEERLVFDLEYIKQKAEQYCQKGKLDFVYFNLVDDVTMTPLLKKEPGGYSFFHFTLQEYLAAKRLVEIDGKKEFFCKGLFDTFLSETEILPMAIGLMNSPGELFEHLEKLPESITFLNLMLRVRSLAYVKKLAPEHLEALWDGISAIFKKDPLKGMLEDKIFKSLRKFQGRAFFASKIIPFLEDEDFSVRRAAAEALSQIPPERLAPGLRQAINSEKVHVRAVALSFSKYSIR